MVKRTVKVGLLFGWSRGFDVDVDENVLRIIATINNREYHLIPNAETIKRLKAVRNKLIQLMDQEIEIEGDIAEVWEKQQVTIPERVIEAFVRVQ
jgi:hypothetical protein